MRGRCLSTKALNETLLNLVPDREKWATSDPLVRKLQTRSPGGMMNWRSVARVSCRVRAQKPPRHLKGLYGRAGSRRGSLDCEMGGAIPDVRFLPRCVDITPRQWHLGKPVQRPPRCKSIPANLRSACAKLNGGYVVTPTVIRRGGWICLSTGSLIRCLEYR
jgi:hypothetical protein